MTEYQLEMLRRTVEGVDLNKATREERAVLAFLEKQGLCSGKGYLALISQAGLAFLDDLEKETQKQAQEKKQETKNKGFTLLNTLFGAVFGYLLAKGPDIIEFLKKLFDLP